ncbi:Na+/H+ antiporter NhaA [Tatumella punctata]|uniref:Na(+)/H(+) antiporter NhaA n=1 Tax=Tatumella punctata TaxID=399969 RepID=A0ABW1VK76_9GAMM
MSLAIKIFRSEAAGGVVLIVAAGLALILANMGWSAEGYQQFLQFTPLTGVSIDGHSPNTLFWINDALMALFFLLVGLEVKQELVSGALATRQQAVFPLLAAIGGMIAPAAIFLLFNGGLAEIRQGWAIPTATDIAFALGILALLGNRVPPVLKVFLMALAVIDDLGAIIIIALFYSGQVSWFALGGAAIVMAVLALMNRVGLRYRSLYLLAGVALWYAVLSSGVHATIAGVILGLMMPVKGQGKHSAALKLAHSLHPWVRWLILPLFAFANAGVVMNNLSMQDVISSLPLGIIAGLLLGKPLGITLICWISSRLGMTRLPENTGIKDIAAIGILCGIGFTMSIFIASLAFGQDGTRLINEAKLGILCGSVLSAVAGYVLLRWRFTYQR